MLTRIDILTEWGGTLELPIEDVDEGYIVKDVGGLDPVRATLVSSGFAQLDGEQYHASRRDKRNITMRIGLESDQVTTTIRQLRTELYRYLMPKMRIQMRFAFDDSESLYIWGRVESFDSPQFTKIPEATISIVCHQPDFFNPILNTYSSTTVDTTWETEHLYSGSVSTGFVLEVLPDRNLSELTLYFRNSSNKIEEMTFNYALQAGDSLKISTVPGDKYAKLTRAGEEISVLYGVSPFAAWPSFEPGSNWTRVYAIGNPIPYTITYMDRYGGL